MDPKAGITRITLTAAQLADLIHQRPEVEVTLIDNAVAQVAEQLKRKVTASGFVDGIFAELENDLKQRYGSKFSLPVEVHRAMLDRAKDAIDSAVGERLQQVVKVACDEALARAQTEIYKRIGDIIATKFSDMVKAAAMVRR